MEFMIEWSPESYETAGGVSLGLPPRGLLTSLYSGDLCDGCNMKPRKNSCAAVSILADWNMLIRNNPALGS